MLLKYLSLYKSSHDINCILNVIKRRNWSLGPPSDLYLWLPFCIISKTMSLLLIGKSYCDFSDFKYLFNFSKGPIKYVNNCILIFPFTGLGRGLACMDIDCLYSLTGGRLSLGKGKISVFNNNFNYIFFSFNRTLNYIVFNFS